MKCPNDNTILLITERKGIEIDYCPECRGVWLDRNELDKFIALGEIKGDVSLRQERRDEPRPHNYDDHRSYDHDDRHHKRHKKENFLGDLFDF